MKPITDAFGSMVFNEAVMKEKLPKDVFKKRPSAKEKRWMPM